MGTVWPRSFHGVRPGWGLACVLCAVGVASLAAHPSPGVFPSLAAASLLVAFLGAGREARWRGVAKVALLLALLAGALGAQVASMGMRPVALSLVSCAVLQASLVLVAFAAARGLGTLLGRVRALSGSSRSWARTALANALTFWVFLPAIALSMVVHRPQGTLTPADAGIRGPAEPVSILADDGTRLAGLWLDQAAPAGAVLLVHGLGAEKAQFLPATAALRARGFSVMTFDMRNHGESGGATCTLGLAEAGDVAAAWRSLLDRTAGRAGPRLLFGISLGGAAVQLAAPSLSGVDGVVLDSTFARADHVAPRLLPLPPPLALPALGLARVFAVLLTGMPVLDSAPIDAASRNHGRYPLLVIHAIGDPLVPYADGEAIAAAYGERAELLSLPGAHHPNGHIVAPRQYDAALLRLAARAARPPG
jgi:uncharacterized protein